MLSTCAGYGGALSVYFGLEARLQLLLVSFVDLVFRSNVFLDCTVRSSPRVGGNVHGGAISVYMGGYSSVFADKGAAVAAVGDTVVRNVSVILEKTEFTSCSARSSIFSELGASGTNVFDGSTHAYGGSYSFYVGAYAWSFSLISSSSVCGATIVSGLSVSVSNTLCSNSTVTSSGSLGANSYGGSMSVVHIGTYAWSASPSSSSSFSSSSACGETSASSLSVSVSNAPCSNCSAVTSSTKLHGANSYGGSMSVMHIGAYAWSSSILNKGSTGRSSSGSSSACGATIASGMSVSVSNAPCSNCSAVTSSANSFGANSYGGSMSVVHVGAYAWSFSAGGFGVASASFCNSTRTEALVVSISNSTYFNSESVSGNCVVERSAFVCSHLSVLILRKPPK